MLGKTGFALDEAMFIKNQTVFPNEEIKDNCERCNTELDELYNRGTDIYDLLVLQCPKCNAVYAYLIDESREDLCWHDEIIEPMNDHSAPLNKTCIKVNGVKKRTLPKKCAKAYAKYVKELYQRNHEINELIQNKLPELYKAGLSLETINFARSETIRRINQAKTRKKRTALLASTIYVKANGIATDGGLWKHKGEGITERQLEDIFGVTRKTIRNWAKM